MAGAVNFGSDAGWSGATWLFNVVLRDIAGRTTEDTLRARVEEIMRENLGWLDLTELDDAELSEVCSILGGGFLGRIEMASRHWLPEIDKPAAIEHLRTLVDGVSDLCRTRAEAS